MGITAKEYVNARLAILSHIDTYLQYDTSNLDDKHKKLWAEEIDSMYSFLEKLERMFLYENN